MLPVTILTGFLGSGKTTFINYLLATDQTKKFAIVENEFGEVNIDGALLNQSQTLELIELSNGCICCSVRGELTEALHELLDKIEKGLISIDWLILETTGLADPGPIIQSFFVDERIRSEVYLDAVITLVDAEHIMLQLDEHPVASVQIGFADRLVLTKLDRVDDAQKVLVLDRIYRINTKASLLEASFGEILPESWLGISAFEIDDELDLEAKSFQFQPDKATFSFQPFTSNSEQSWNDNIRSYLFEAGALDLDQIGEFMTMLVERHGNDMLRYKGILAIADEPKKLVIQGVYKVVGFDYGDEWQPSEKIISQFVVIGRNLPFETLLEEFKQTETYE
ncbi:GTP-binding protein [Ignatzschineria rhizosphaerae]|uniref:GTP-binding protein n=1 Tax=Ignatzschineria rhizosphaerae TaxID=2923279 RepID=A0ABY3X136_9GAMM|nr:GTP-binding protein [Ignatzschineria rhizosphaerae]UNM96578.1 GTP-binding protein [Ignatzschineria rhizosphaerae]